MKKIFRIFSIVICFMLAIVLSSCEITFNQTSGSSDSSATTSTTTTENKVTGDTVILQTNTVPEYTTVTDDNVAAYVAAIVMPATVEINCNITYSYVQSSYGFYGSRSQTYTGSATSIATGMVINEDGYIVTNAHVVNIENASYYPSFKYVSRDVYVNYADSKEQFKCEIIDYDEDLDLCILKMDTTNVQNIQYVTYYDLTSPTDDKYVTDEAVKLLYGETAIAIGNANAYGISVTKGVVSAPLRTFVEDGITTYAIQTDTAINSGNSGGPLCNSYGLVIGINSFKTVSTSVEGMAFAIPSYVIMNYIDTVNTNNNLSIQYYKTAEKAHK